MAQSLSQSSIKAAIIRNASTKASTNSYSKRRTTIDSAFWIPEQCCDAHCYTAMQRYRRNSHKLKPYTKNPTQTLKSYIPPKVLKALKPVNPAPHGGFSARLKMQVMRPLLESNTIPPSFGKEIPSKHGLSRTEIL